MATKSKLLFVPVAIDNQMQTGVNIHRKKKAKHTYIKNACVACISAKISNPDTDVALVSNLELEAKYKELLNDNGVITYVFPFDKFRFNDSYRWGLAFYKLCALYHVLEKLDYDLVAYVDSDVCIQDNLDGLWLDAERHIMLYDYGDNPFNNKFTQGANDLLPDSYLRGG